MLIAIGAVTMLIALACVTFAGLHSRRGLSILDYHCSLQHRPRNVKVEYVEREVHEIRLNDNWIFIAVVSSN
jgi:hypothetical protein